MTNTSKSLVNIGLALSVGAFVQNEILQTLLAVKTATMDTSGHP
jgi:hypothetical protein